MGLSLAQAPSLHQVWRKSVQHFLSKLTNKPTDTGQNITSLAELICTSPLDSGQLGEQYEIHVWFLPSKTVKTKEVVKI